MDEEVRLILAEAPKDPAPSAAAAAGLGSRISAQFTDLGGVELELPPRTSSPEPGVFT